MRKFSSIIICLALCSCTSKNALNLNQLSSVSDKENESAAISSPDTLNWQSAFSSSISASQSFFSSSVAAQRLDVPQNWSFYPLKILPFEIPLPSLAARPLKKMDQEETLMLNQKPDEWIVVQERFHRNFKNLDSFILNVCVESAPWQEWSAEEKPSYSIAWSKKIGNANIYWLSEACMIAREQHRSAITAFGIIEYQDHYYEIEIHSKVRDLSERILWNIRRNSLEESTSSLN
jgi:hypothetical protein